MASKHSKVLHISLRPSKVKLAAVSIKEPLLLSIASYTPRM